MSSHLDVKTSQYSEEMISECSTLKILQGVNNVIQQKS